MYEQVLTDMSPMASVIELAGVRKTFVQWQKGEAKNLKTLLKPEKKEKVALNNISFTIREGEFTAYAGANGAGKSTTMRLLTGMLLPTTGNIKVLGKTPGEARVHLMKEVGILFGNRSELWWDHTIDQSFEWKKVVWDIDEVIFKRQKERLVTELDLGGIMGSFARELSLGQRMKADLGLMLLHNPHLILLDEPTIGLDVLAKRQMIDYLKKLNQEQGTTIVVTSHDMDDLEEMAQRILLISQGDLAFDGSFEELRETVEGNRRLIVYFEEGAGKAFPGMKILVQSPVKWEYGVDFNEMPLERIFHMLAGVNGIKDIEIKKPSIEEVIANLYTEWRNEGK